MSPSFLLLPGEIRVNIYEYLFNEECRIEFTHYDLKILAVERGYHWTWSKAILESQRPYGLSFNVVPSEYVAILRTCHQVYDEAIPIFLARTFFCYAARLYPRLPSGRLNHDSCQLPVQRLQDIQKLEVNVEREEKIDSRTLAEMVASLVEDASALKRLFLIFFLQPGKGAHNSYRTWLQSIVHTSRIAKTIAAANDLQEIHITVSDDAETGGPDFEPLIYAIAPKESWSFDLEDYCYDEATAKRTRADIGDLTMTTTPSLDYYEHLLHLNQSNPADSPSEHPTDKLGKDDIASSILNKRGC